jgi:hypothetical protein
VAGWKSGSPLSLCEESEVLACFQRFNGNGPVDYDVRMKGLELRPLSGVWGRVGAPWNWTFDPRVADRGLRHLHCHVDELRCCDVFPEEPPDDDRAHREAGNQVPGEEHGGVCEGGGGVGRPAGRVLPEAETQEGGEDGADSRGSGREDEYPEAEADPEETSDSDPRTAKMKSKSKGREPHIVLINYT